MDYNIEAGGNSLTKGFFLLIGSLSGFGAFNMEEIDLLFSIILKGISILSFTAALFLSCLTIYHKYLKNKE